MSSSDSDRSQSRRFSLSRSQRSRSREKQFKKKSGKDKKLLVKIPQLGGSFHSFKQFSLIQSEKLNPDVLQKCYDKYKSDWQQRQNERFVSKSKNDGWFNEKYNPEYLDHQQKERKQICQRNYKDFVKEFKNGTYDSIQFRVDDVNQIGTVYELDQDEDFSQNFNSFINNQTIEVVLSSSVQIRKAPYFGFDPDYATLFIKGLSKQIFKYQIKNILEKNNIKGWKSIVMSDPLKKADFTRNCWIQFYSEEQSQQALGVLNNFQYKNEELAVSKAFTKLKRIKILKNYPSSRLSTDIQTMKKLIQKLDSRVEIGENVILTKQYESLHKQYDTLLVYLRKIHYFDFYTCTQFENERMVALKVGSIFLRIQADYQELANIQTIFKKIKQNADKKIQQISQPQQYMNLVKEEVLKFVKDSQSEAKGIWKCSFCDKKFKTNQFLAKHIISRHQEIKNNTVMLQLYLKDPNKITSYYIRDESRTKNYSSNYKFMGKRPTIKRQNYRDFDQPEHEITKKPVVGSKPQINFLDI